MKTVYIYKLSTYNYFFTTAHNDTFDPTNKYEYVCNVEAEDSDEKISTLIKIFSPHNPKDKNRYDNKSSVFPSDIFDKFKEDFYEKTKEDLSTCVDVFDCENTHDVFSNVHDLKIVGTECNVNCVLIKAQPISTIDVKQFIVQQKPQIKTIVELDCALNAFTNTELEIYTVKLEISTCPYATMRNLGSYMTTIDEYYIPSLGVSYNFCGTTNILIGKTLEARYVERYWTYEKNVKFAKSTISGEKLTNILDALKSYTNFQLSIGKLFVTEPVDENTQEIHQTEL